MHSLFTDAFARNLAFFGSLTLSLWAVLADPVVDTAAARLIIAAEQSPASPTALPVGEAWLLSLVVAQVGAVLDIGMENAARVCNALFCLWLSLAFVVLVQRLGGDGRTACLAALLILLLPAINGLRPHLTSYLPFAALSVAALAAICTHRLEGGRGSLVLAVLLVMAASSLRIEALALLLALLRVAPRQSPAGVRVALGLAAAAVLLALLGMRATIDALDHAGLSWPAFAAAPGDAIADGWTRARDEFSAVVAAVRDRLLGEFAGGFAVSVVLLGLASAALSAVVATLGVLSLPAAHGAGLRDGLDRELRPLWAFVLIWFWLAAAATAIGRASIDPAAVLTPALIAAGAAPFSLRAAIAAIGDRRPLARSVAAALLAACAVAGLAGLDLRRNDAYLKQAGSWLRVHIAADAPIFFGHAAIAVYAGRHETLARTDHHAWRETSALFWSGRRRDYRVIVGHVDGDRGYREAHLLRAANGAPVRRFDGTGGDRVVVFVDAD